MGILRTGRLALMGAAAGAAMMIATVPAFAQGAGGGVVIGSGTITPGLTANFQAQTISFTGNLYGGGATLENGPIVDVGVPCTFGGSSSNPLGGDNVAFGMGTVSGNCTNIAASVTYVRVGAVVLLDGTGTVGTAPTGPVVGACLFLTTQTPPITSYTVVCASAAVSA